MRRLLCFFGIHKWRVIVVPKELSLSHDWWLREKSKDLEMMRAGKYADTVIKTCRACGAKQ